MTAIRLYGQRKTTSCVKNFSFDAAVVAPGQKYRSDAKTCDRRSCGTTHGKFLPDYHKNCRMHSHGSGEDHKKARAEPSFPEVFICKITAKNRTCRVMCPHHRSAREDKIVRNTRLFLLTGGSTLIYQTEIPRKSAVDRTWHSVINPVQGGGCCGIRCSET